MGLLHFTGYSLSSLSWREAKARTQAQHELQYGSNSSRAPGEMLHTGSPSDLYTASFLSFLDNQSPLSHDSTTYSSLGLPVIDWHQENTPQTFPQPILWRQFLNLSSLFPCSLHLVCLQEVPEYFRIEEWPIKFIYGLFHRFKQKRKVSRMYLNVVSGCEVNLTIASAHTVFTLTTLSCKLFHISHVNQFQIPRKQKVKFIPTALSLGGQCFGLFILSYCCDQIPGEREPKGKGFLLVHSVRGYHGAEAGQQECEEAGDPVHTTRKSREMEAHAVLSPCMHLRTMASRMLLLISFQPS